MVVTLSSIVMEKILKRNSYHGQVRAVHQVLFGTNKKSGIASELLLVVIEKMPLFSVAVMVGDKIQVAFPKVCPQLRQDAGTLDASGATVLSTKQ